MFQTLKIYSTVSETPNISDRFLSRTILKLIPRFVTPNHVTVFRYLTIPVIIFLLFKGYNTWGIILFSISAFSDAVDGAMARTRQQITDWGKMNDPLADKLLISTVGALVVSLHISFYLIATIIIIEIFLILNGLVKIKRGEKTITALLPGKIKMIFQSFGIAFVLLFLVVGWPWLLPLATVLLYLSIFFALLSLMVYSSL